jgi:hypothetical protein
MRIATGLSTGMKNDDSPDTGIVQKEILFGESPFFRYFPKYAKKRGGKICDFM